MLETRGVHNRKRTHRDGIGLLTIGVDELLIGSTKNPELCWIVWMTLDEVARVKSGETVNNGIKHSRCELLSFLVRKMGKDDVAD